MIKQDEKGQGTLEYILVLLAILIAVIAGANAFIRPSVNTMFQNAGTQMDNATNRLTQNQ